MGIAGGHRWRFSRRSVADLLLFAFLVAGVVGGFAGGYYWRMLVSEKKAKGGPGASGPQE